MDWWQTVAEWVVRPRVQHRLPGRLRVHLPFLKNACPSDSPLVELVQRLLTVPEPIRSVRASTVTGNAVIEYDASSVTEAEVLAFLRHALHLCLRSRQKLTALGQEGVIAEADHLEDVLRQGLRYRLELDPDLEMPDDWLS